MDGWHCETITIPRGLQNPKTNIDCQHKYLFYVGIDTFSSQECVCRWFPFLSRSDKSQYQFSDQCSRYDVRYEKSVIKPCGVSDSDPTRGRVSPTIFWLKTPGLAARTFTIPLKPPFCIPGLWCFKFRNSGNESGDRASFWCIGVALYHWSARKSLFGLIFSDK